MSPSPTHSGDTLRWIQYVVFRANQSLEELTTIAVGLQGPHTPLWFAGNVGGRSSAAPDALGLARTVIERLEGDVDEDGGVI
jgi:hypothetical protein